MLLKSWRAQSLIVKKCRSVLGVCRVPSVGDCLAQPKRSEKYKLKCNSSWWLRVLHTVFFFKRPVLSPRLPFISPQWEKSSLSQLVCLLKYKSCLLFKWDCGPANIHCDNSSYLHDRKLSVSPAGECKMETSLPVTLANKQRGHLIYWGGLHKSIIADTHITDSISMCSVTVCLQLQNAQIINTVNTGIVSRQQMWTNKQSARTTASHRPDTSSTMLTIDIECGRGTLGYNDMKRRTKLQGRQT